MVISILAKMNRKKVTELVGILFELIKLDLFGKDIRTIKYIYILATDRLHTERKSIE